MQFSIKPATPDDIAQIAALAYEIWNEYYPSILGQAQVDYMLNRFYSAEALKEQMMEGHRFHLILADGIFGGYISESNSSASEGFLHKFYLSKSIRGLGIGHEAFHAVFDQKTDLKFLRLTVNRMNYKSVNFYFSLGFFIEKTIEIDIDNGFIMDDFMMLKKFE